MTKTSKSPIHVASEALAVGTRVLRRYAHRNSPKRFSQPQLFACLVLKTFFKTDYRGISQLLDDLPELTATLGLDVVPHFTTLQKASQRLLRLRRANRLLTAIVRRALRRRRKLALAAFDSTGFDSGHVSSYYVKRRSRDPSVWQTTTYTGFPKLEAGVDCASHLVIAAIPRRGPRVDVDRFIPLLEAALRRVKLGSALADAGFDSEPNHRYARQKRGVKSFIPATAGRPSAKPPTGRYRRQMRQRLNKRYGRYGQRSQAETVFSMIKKRLGAAVHGRSYWSQCRDLMLLTITYDIMLL